MSEPKLIPTKLAGLVVLEPVVHGDQRGFLTETYSEPVWSRLGISEPFVQENHSRSRQKGTLRGLHFQTSPGQAKLVRCSQGAVFDVAVDLRRESPTFGDWEGHVLDDETHRQMWIPIGFAHGFQVITEIADVDYKLTSLYDPETESQIAWDDPEIGVEWPLADPLLSERDKTAPPLAELTAGLPF